MVDSEFMDLTHRSSSGASVSSTSNGFRLTIPVSSKYQYRLAQLDDYALLARDKFLWRAPLTLTLRARVSSDSIPGTWGFGLWDDPFGIAIWLKDSPFRLPSLPNAIWFFHASQQNYLSFRDDKPAQGFLAQVFSSPSFHPSMLAIVPTFLFSQQKARQALSRIINEDSAAISVDTTQWHCYRFEWSLNRSAFWVDETLVLDTPMSPRAPLGMVIWIDNQYAAFTPDGKMNWGLEKNPTEVWLEIGDIEIKGQA